MARIRSIKPEFWTDERIIDLSIPARLLFIGMWNFADDDGFTENKPRQIKLRVLPADEIDAEELIDELVQSGLLERWHDPDTNTKLLLIANFAKHQYIKNRAKERYPNATPALPEDYPSNGGGVQKTPMRKGKEGKKNPPTPHADDPDSGAAQRVFAHWLDTTGRDPSRTRLGAERRRVIDARLKDYPEADLIAAIDGNQLSAFHQGDNPGRKKYDDLTLILRNGAHLERFRDLTTQDDSPNPPVDSAAIDAFLESFPIDPTGFFTKNRATG